MNIVETVRDFENFPRSECSTINDLINSLFLIREKYGNIKLMKFNNDDVSSYDDTVDMGVSCLATGNIDDETYCCIF
jgi:hypothetical protein